MRRPLVASLAFASCILAACGSDSRSTKPLTLGTSAAKVIHGTLDTGTTHDDVVYIEFLVDPSTGEGGACSGTLIAPNVVTTARHCVSNIDQSVYPPTTGADFQTKYMAVYLHTDPTGVGVVHGPDAKVIKIVHDGAGTLADHDFAMLVLDRNVSTDISPIRLAAPPVAGEGVFVVGYGMTESDPPGPATGTHERYWRDGLSIQAIGPSSGGFLGANEILLGESICEGDSGGPVKDSTSGALLALTSRGGNGVTSTAPASCEGSSAENIFTRVDKFADLIKSTLAAYGRIPWEEGAPKPPDPTTPPPAAGALGSPCGSASDCTSNLCVDADGKQVCSQRCSDSAPCPGGYDCASGYCVPSTPTPPPPDGDSGTTPPPPTDDAGLTFTPTGDAPITTNSKGGCAVARAPSSSRSSFAAMGALGIALAIAARRRRR